MPFKSEKQRKYLFANEPKLAKKWSNMYGDKIVGLGGMKTKDIENAKKEYYSIIKYLNKRNIPFIVKEINKGRKIPIHQRDIKIIGKPNIRMIDILQIMKGEDVILGLGGVKPVFTLKFINSEIKRIKPIMKKYQVIAQKNLSYYKDLMTVQKYYLMLQSEKKKLSKK